MELFLSALVYGALIASVVLPCLLCVFLVHCFRKNMDKKKRGGLFALILAAEIAVLGWFGTHPVFVCPAELRPYVSQEQQESIIGFNRGPYSARIPILPVRIVVESADGDKILVRVNYWPFGTTQMSLAKDGPYRYPLQQ